MPPSVTGVINEFAHPPWGSLEREFIGILDQTGNPYALQRPRGPIAVDAFGIAWEVFSAPPGASRIERLTTQYADNFMTVGVLYTDFAGHDFFGQMFNQQFDGQYFLWDQPLPTSVNIWIFPNFAVSVFWLVAL